jgi:hypothetical protein
MLSVLAFADSGADDDGAKPGRKLDLVIELD